MVGRRERTRSDGSDLGAGLDTGGVNRSFALVALAAVALVVGAVVLVTGGRDRSAPAAEAPPTLATPAAGELRTISRATGIPRRALTAYVEAAERVRQEDSQCRIGWNTIAGIGSSESSHGAFGGATIGDDGVVEPKIIGVALDGTGGNRAIEDTDGGRLDGDTTWDRAVGPMQFIPTTWEVWGADANGDGVADPHHIGDAALAAARYLCDAGDHDLTGSEQWSAAVLTYNASGSYARKVAQTATEYADAI